MTPNEEILQVIRYAPGPIGAAGIYEKLKTIDNMSDVSSRLSQLYQAGKVARQEIVTANNRKSFAYTIPAKVEAVAAVAAAPVAPGLAEAVAAAVDAISPAAAAPAPAAKAKRKPKADPVAQALGQVEQALASSPPPARDLPAADPARIADGMLSRVLDQARSAAPLTGDLDITTAPGSITINVERVEIHISIGVAA